MYKIYALIIIFFANFLDYLDRFIISSLVTNIQRDFNLTEFQLGMIISAFIVGYALASPFVGLAADKKSRPKIFAGCILLWSIASMASGLADDFLQLLITRMFLGIGEAGAIIIGPSLISDFFPIHVRGRMLAIFFLAMPIGSVAGHMTGGQLVKDKIILKYETHSQIGLKLKQEGRFLKVESVEAGSSADKSGIKSGYWIEAVGRTEVKSVEEYLNAIKKEEQYKEIRAIIPETHYKWRLTLFIAGAPGILLTIFMFFLKDPPRTSHDSGHSFSLKDFSDYKRILSQKSIFLIILIQTIAAFVIAPLSHFGVKYLETERNMPKENATLLFGIIGVIAGLLGTLSGGYLGDKLSKFNKGAYIMLAGIAFLAGLPCLWFALFIENVYVFAPLMFLGMFFYFSTMTTINTQLVNVVSQTDRSKAYALTLLLMHIFGDLSSPPLFGRIADEISMKKAYMTFPLLLIVSGVLSFIAVSHAKKDAEANSESPKTN